ncbi:hypothetical protein [Parafrankia sp. FMc2]|uniref:hypothetical protein n=1 Tax=Parafrankia sp. FMc2 TaxID=3233196 RepID=UPI0034D70AE1
MEWNWQLYPDAVNHRDLRPVKPGRIVGLGALCDLWPPRTDDGSSQSFSVSEFVTLDDGRRVILHEDRGFTVSRVLGGPGSGAGQFGETRESIIQNVLNVVLPDGDQPSDHPWSWLADLGRARGLQVTADELRGLPYEVVLTDTATRWLSTRDLGSDHGGSM